MDNNEEKGARINIRLTDKQYEIMKTLGGALGIELDSQAAKHFFLKGLESSMGPLSASLSVKTAQGSQDQLKAFYELFSRLEIESKEKDEKAA